jgi:aryl-alcohol dehydrogenase-like predicted oxidoreductase
LAQENNLTLTQLALAFVNDRPFTTSNIIGATNLEQLKENIDTHAISLSKEILERIEEIHTLQPNPAP